MPAITTFGGAAVRSFGRGIEQVPAVLPANTVLFYNITDSTTQSSTPAAGWSVLDTSNKYIRGTATQGDINTTVAAASGTITLTGTTGYDGSHTGNISFLSSPYNFNNLNVNYLGSSGPHLHALSTADVSGALANTISITTVTSSQTSQYLPAGCVVFRKIAPSSLNFTSFTPSGNGYFFGKASAANTAWTDRTIEIGATGTSVGSGGYHAHHGTSTYGYWGGTSYSTYVFMSSGVHTDHAFSFNVHIRLKSRFLKAWVASVDEPIEYGMIVMYCGNLSNLPAGWRLCDGTLGTPNMVDYFIGWNSNLSHGDVWNSTSDVTLPSTQTGTTSTSSWYHGHASTYTNIRGSGAMHANESIPHSHSFTVTAASGSYSSPLYNLAFIQYKGI